MLVTVVPWDYTESWTLREMARDFFLAVAATVPFYPLGKSWWRDEAPSHPEMSKKGRKAEEQDCLSSNWMSSQPMSFFERGL